jgi:hypothetical protein
VSHGSDARMVKLAELWERTSARGTRYFSGFLGDAQVLMFDAGEREHPTKAGETVHVWRLMVQERDPARRPQARDAPAKGSARPAGRGDGWRGPSAYRRGNGAARAPAADDGAFADDALEDLYR